MAKTPKVGKVTVAGKDYKLQHPGVGWYLDNSDACRNAHGIIQSGKYAQSLLDYVVVEPAGLKVNDFETVGEIEELIQKVDSFLKS